VSSSLDTRVGPVGERREVKALFCIIAREKEKKKRAKDWVLLHQAKTQKKGGPRGSLWREGGKATRPLGLPGVGFPEGEGTTAGVCERRGGKENVYPTAMPKKERKRRRSPVSFSLQGERHPLAGGSEQGRAHE